MNTFNIGLTEWLIIAGVCGCLCLLVIAAVVLIVVLSRKKKADQVGGTLEVQ